MVDLIDLVLEGFKNIVSWITGLFMSGLTSGYRALTEEVFGTPTPETNGAFVFGEPTNAPWIAIRDALIGGEIMLISLLLLVISVQGRHTVRIFNIGSSYMAQRTKKTAWVGAVIIVTWYWISVLMLYLVEGFTIALIPNLDSLTHLMINLLEVSLTNPVLTFMFALIGALSMWVLEALYFVREILLYVYVYGMPIALAFAYGNVPVLATIATGFSKRFVPLAVLPLPAAVVFKGYDLLYSQGVLAPGTPFLRYLVAVSLPLVAVYVTWKTFAYATPLTARAIGTVTRGAFTVGAVATGASVAGRRVATTAARWGPKAAAGQAMAQRAAARADDSSSTEGGDESDGDGPPWYRRTMNDPDHH